jgi:hypothetical protein
MATTARQRKAEQNSSYTTPKRRTLQVRLDGEVYRVKVPKKYRIAALIKMSAHVAELQGETPDTQNPAQLAEFTDAIDSIIGVATSLFVTDDETKTRESSRARFTARLEDDDDDLDLDVIEMLIQRVVAAAADGQGEQYPT